MQTELHEQNHQGRKECGTLKELKVECCDREYGRDNGTYSWKEIRAALKDPVCHAGEFSFAPECANEGFSAEKLHTHFWL